MYSSCPCCAFSTNDLFLPPSERQQATEIDESTETNASHEDDSSSSKLPSGYFLSPLESLEHLSTTPLVDTHGHAHLQRHQDDEEEKNEYHNAQDVDNDTNPCNPFNNIVSLTCSVAPSDWLDCLKYAAQYKHRRAAIGVHPWYLNELLVNNNEISRNDDDADTVESNTQLNPTWLSDMESLLQQHPGCMIGEIGLCKMARFVRTYPGGKTQALQLQRHVLEQQLKLAVQYQRPASIHCVQQQGVLVPPAIALHSFSGTAHQIQQLLQWEQSLQRDTPLLYFGFSHVVNAAMSTSEKAKRQTRLAVLQVPYDRLLAESDVPRDIDVAAGTAGAIAFLAFVLERPLLEVAEQTRENGLRFLSTLSNNVN